MRRLVPSALVAAAATAVLVPLALLSSSAPVLAADLDRESAYTCQYSGAETVVVPSLDGLPLLGSLPVPVLPSVGGSDTVAVSVGVDAPAQISAGDALRLKGTATFTFGANATTTNASTVFTFLSDSFGLDVTIGSYSRFLRITELTTDRSSVGEPVVTARWTLPELLVPSDASGRVVLALPHEAVASNPVSTTPESVAFTGMLRTDSNIQPDRAVACALVAGEDTAIGAIRVAGSGTTEEPTDPTTSPTAAPTAAPTSPGLPGTTDPGGSLGTVPPPGAPVASTPPDGAPVGEQPAAEAPLTGAVLAAEPIPPQTVGSGIALPGWALLLGGAFVAGGIFLGVSSHRGVRRASTVAAALAVIVVVPTPLTPQAPAEAATGQAQVTLLCVYEAEGSASNDVPKSQPTGLSFTLDVPDAVAPGDVVTLTGSASVQAPEDIRSQGAALGYNTLDAISDSFSVGRTIGSGEREVFFADRWQTGKTAFSNPLVVRAPLYFPAFKVPEDASGSIKLELPRNEVLDRRPAPFRNGDTPPRVAVEFLASASGNGTSITYVVSCWRSDGGTGSIATIPVVAASATPPPTTGGETPAPGTPTTPGTPGTGTATTPPGTVPTDVVTPGAPTDVPSGAPGAPAPGAAPAVPGAPTTATPALLQGASATVATSYAAAPTSGQQVVVPTWLAVLALLLAAGGYGVAAWNHLRMRSSRTGARA